MRDYTPLIGKVFGRLTVKEICEREKYVDRSCICQCECGKLKKIVIWSLESGKTVSCGCYLKEKAIETHTKHGFASRSNKLIHSLYKAWHSMISRCENEKHRRYKDYGGRGIKVYESWHDIEIFMEYILRLNPEKGLTLDRIDNDGNYEPGNIRFATYREQANNRRRR